MTAYRSITFRRFPVTLSGMLLAALVVGQGCNDGNITNGNSAPSATILQPTNDGFHNAADALELLGVVGDTGTPNSALRVTWVSSESGVLFDGSPEDEEGSTRFVWDSPSIGTHQITLSVVDPGGLSGSHSVRVEVIGNTDPTCAITTPTGDAPLNSGSPVLFQGQVGDSEFPVTELTVSWDSDVDGVIGTEGPDEAGVVSTDATLAMGTHEVTLTVVDPLGATCLAELSLTMNGPPTAPVVSFAPEAPTTLDDLRVVIDSPAADPEDAGDVVYAFSWTEDLSTTSVTGDLVLAADLDKGEEWEVTVIATDADGFSSAPITATVTVVNSPPSAPTVEVTPLTPTQAGDLSCAVEVLSTDADDDPVTYAFSWELNGAATGLTGPTLPWDETSVGDFWTCVGVPTDGESDGLSSLATVTISAGCAALGLDPVTPGEVSVPDDAALRLASGDFTVEAWIRPEGFSTGATLSILSKRGAVSGDGWHFGVGGLQTSAIAKPVYLVSDFSSSALVGNSQMGAFTWHHVALTFDSGSGLATLWVDGANAGSSSMPQPSPNTTADLVIGAASNGGGEVWSGQLDDVRISDVVRYSSAFVPTTQLTSDADTLAWWGFEEASGAVAKDLSGGGHDGTLGGAATFDLVQSTCANDQAPTAPSVVVTPDYPLLSQDIFCSLVGPAVDPEGATVTYDGQWLLHGAPSGLTFSSFPAQLSSALTAEADEWTCLVTASDGTQDGPAGEDSVFTGALPLGGLLVPNPAVTAGTTFNFLPPVAGLVRATLDNPDASRDGVFEVDVLGYGSTWVFTGYRDWAYAGATVAGWSTTDVEFNADPSLGTLTLELNYEPSPGIDNTGPDELELLFVYDTQLSTNGATMVLSSNVGAQETTVSQGSIVVGAGERVLLEATTCGFGGGAHGLYADADGVVGNDGIARMDTGFAGNCQIPLQSRPLGVGAWNLTLVNEDDFFSDNTDPRQVNLYRYSP